MKAAHETVTGTLWLSLPGSADGIALSMLDWFGFVDEDQEILLHLRHAGGTVSIYRDTCVLARLGEAQAEAAAERRNR